MRIQHNIMAMNAYRNYTSNTSALSKNLEKLSSGYKINRAGDDAAGLAISEKMRAQITGLSQAQSNAKSGINLVQTAEGALTEVHDMLNRMVKLTDQAANGTYDKETDRANLQKEFDQLRSEIDRIADASNFNGIKLLDGSLSSGATTSENKLNINSLLQDALGMSKGQAGKETTAALDALDGTTHDAGIDATYEFTFNNNGVEEKHSVQVTLDKGSTDIYFSVNGGEKTKAVVAKATDAGKLSSANLGDAIKEALETQKGINENFTITNTTGKLTFEHNDVGTAASKLVGVSQNVAQANAPVDPGSVAVTTTQKALDKVPQLDLDKLRMASTITKADAQSKIFEVNGRKFAILDHSTTADQAKALGLGDDVVTISLTTGDKTTAATAADAKLVMDKINEIAGKEVFSQQQSADTKLTFNGANTTENATGGLTLQIGDTSEKFNQLTVSISDMHSAALGIADLSIAKQSDAQAAVETLKNAINSVSSTRGDLGAMQNRLDHTINNLSVMQENTQDAESTIRDVDVADEMMTYTKNNILVQSAQAMLAQANQVPQGVLQLLQ